MSNEKLGVGFAGAGAVTQAIHLPTLVRLIGDFEVRRVFDTRSGVAAAVAARVGAIACSSFDQLLDDDQVDIVAVCTPQAFHADQVIAACRAGKRAVFCEKPLATSVEEAEAVAAASVETGVPVLVGAMHRYDPGWRAAEEAWDDLPQTSYAIRSSIVLPPNARFEDFAAEVVGRASGFSPAGSLEAQAAMVRGGVVGLAIHDLPLIQSLLSEVDDLDILDARYLAPVGYHVVLRVGGKRVELHALMSETWRPEWTLEVVAPDQRLLTTFTPSYVHAGSAVTTVQRRDRTVTLGPYPGNGYEAEWRETSKIVRGETDAPHPAALVEDLRFALEIAAGAAELVRQPVTSGASA